MQNSYHLYRCVLQSKVHGRPSSARGEARESHQYPSRSSYRATEMAGERLAAVGTPRPKAEVVPGPGNPGGVQDRLCGGGEGLAAVLHSEHAMSPGPAQGSG